MITLPEVRPDPPNKTIAKAASEEIMRRQTEVHLRAATENNTSDLVFKKVVSTASAIALSPRPKTIISAIKKRETHLEEKPKTISKILAPTPDRPHRVYELKTKSLDTQPKQVLTQNSTATKASLSEKISKTTVSQPNRAKKLATKNDHLTSTKKVSAIKKPEVSFSTNTIPSVISAASEAAETILKSTKEPVPDSHAATFESPYQVLNTGDLPTLEELIMQSQDAANDTHEWPLADITIEDGQDQEHSIAPIELDVFLSPEIEPRNETHIAGALDNLEEDEAIRPPSSSEQVVHLLSERIQLLGEEEASIATIQLETVIELTAQLRENPDEEPDPVIKQKLEKVCTELLEQLHITYDETMLESLLTKLLDTSPESSQTLKPMEDTEAAHTLYDVLREIAGGDPLGNLGSLSHTVKYAILHQLHLGKLAVGAHFDDKTNARVPVGAA